MLLEELRTRVLTVAQDCYRDGLMVATAGNFSARDSSTGLIAITPGNYPYDTMQVSDIVIVDPEGKVIEGERKPSSDTDVHTYIYQNKNDVNGIVHIHSIYANAFGSVGMHIPPVLGTMQVMVGGNVPVLPFTHFGSSRGQKRIVTALKTRRAVVMGGHGLTCAHSSIETALMTARFVEENAKVYWLGLQIGKPKRVPSKISRT